MPENVSEEASIIVEILETLMWLHGWNQQELAARWKVSQSAVSKILAGDRRELSYSLLQRLIETFELDPALPFQVKKSRPKK